MTCARVRRQSIRLIDGPINHTVEGFERRTSRLPRVRRQPAEQRNVVRDALADRERLRSNTDADLAPHCHRCSGSCARDTRSTFGYLVRVFESDRVRACSAGYLRLEGRRSRRRPRAREQPAACRPTERHCRPYHRLRHRHRSKPTLLRRRQRYPYSTVWQLWRWRQ